MELIVACGTERNFAEFALETRLHFISFRGSPASLDTLYALPLSSFYMDRNMLSWIYGSLVYSIKGASLSLPLRKAIDELFGKRQPEIYQWFLTPSSTMNVKQDIGITNRQIK